MIRRIVTDCGVFALLMGVWLAGSAEAQTYDWTGFYVGAHAGFAKPKDKVTAVPPPNYNSANEVIINRENGFNGGIQGGYNHQFAWVVPGVEADLGYMGFNGDRVSPQRFNVQQDTFAVSSGGLFGTVTGRFGVASERALLYVKGGFAYASLDLGVRDHNPVGLTINASDRSIYTGWTIGGGIEFGIDRNWTIKTEYLFADLGDKTIAGVANSGTTYRWKHDVSAHLIKAGINFRF